MNYPTEIVYMITDIFRPGSNRFYVYSDYFVCRNIMIMSVQDTQLFVTNVVEMTFFGDRYSVEMCVEMF